MSPVPPPPPRPPGFPLPSTPPGTGPTAFPPPTPPGAPGDSRGAIASGDVRPKKRWIWISLAIVAVGVVAAIVVAVLGLVGISNQVDGFERVGEGSGTIEIDTTSQRVIYSESGSGFASVTIRDPNGNDIRTRVYVGSVTYSFDGRSGQAALTFQPTEPGTYTVETRGDIAVGSSLAGPLVRAIVLPFVVGGFSVLVGLVMLTIVLVRRSRSKAQFTVT